MLRALFRIPRRVLSRFRRASPAVLTGLGIVGALLMVAAGVATYQTYDYIQHDNDFCVSCHLMEDPFERFSQSVHREVSCKACHQPSPIDRFAMGVRQFVANPERIEVHAEVPDSRCEHCHVEGDPELWVHVENSRGHDLHLNGGDPVLRDLECVSCHSVSVHEFGTTTDSCGRAGCHDNDTDVHLGEMGQLRLSCEACHDFRAPLADESGELTGDRTSLRPTSVQCLSCHDMRERVDLNPLDEPHGAVCGVCHNAHSQRSSRDPVNSCTDALCHGFPEEVEDRHHQWEEVDLDDCVQCHAAHTFRIDGSECLDCHDDIVNGEGRLPGP